MEPPGEEFTKIWYTGDGRHYVFQLSDGDSDAPRNEQEALRLREENEGCWDEDVNVGGNVYSKISIKPRTYGQVNQFSIKTSTNPTNRSVLQSCHFTIFLLKSVL